VLKRAENHGHVIKSNMHCKSFSVFMFSKTNILASIKIHVLEVEKILDKCIKINSKLFCA